MQAIGQCGFPSDLRLPSDLCLLVVFAIPGTVTVCAARFRKTTGDDRSQSLGEIEISECKFESDFHGDCFVSDVFATPRAIPTNTLHRFVSL